MQFNMIQTFMFTNANTSLFNIKRKLCNHVTLLGPALYISFNQICNITESRGSNHNCSNNIRDKISNLLVSRLFMSQNTNFYSYSDFSDIYIYIYIKRERERVFFCVIPAFLYFVTGDIQES